MSPTHNNKDTKATQIHDSALLFRTKSWVRFKILGWLLKDEPKVRVERLK